MKKTNQPTEVAKTISGGVTQEDTVAKRLFSINEIIAWILKLCIEEFSTINVQDIVNEWLAKADKRIGTEPVLPDVPPRRSAVGTEDKSKTDGTVYFDFRTEIPLPNASPMAPLLVIDMELQNEYKKRLALHKRSVYYNCRLISSQPGRLTGGKVVYPRLCRTCSVWIYPNAPKRLFIEQIELGVPNRIHTARIDRRRKDRRARRIEIFRAKIFLEREKDLVPARKKSRDELPFEIVKDPRLIDRYKDLHIRSQVTARDAKRPNPHGYIVFLLTAQSSEKGRGVFFDP